MITGKTDSTQQKIVRLYDLKVGVVLVNLNGGEFTIPCIESLVRGNVIPWKIVVVDNASNDGSPDQIIDKFSSVHLLRNNENKGFSTANNQGIRYLLSEGADYVWVLNNDTRVDQNCLGELLSAANFHPYTACFTGKIYYDKPSGKIWYAGGFRHRLHLGVKHRGEGETEEGRYNEIEEVEFISGCCMFFPIWSFKSLGFFIDDYFMYSEDNEWAWRVFNAGESLLYVPNAKIWHNVSASVIKYTGDKGKNSPSAFALYFLIRNNLWTIRRHAIPAPRKYLGIVINILIEVRMIIKHLIRGDLIRSKRIWNGMVSGLFRSIPQYNLLDL